MISIIIPVYNEEALLAGQLSRLADQIDGHEIIVVDGGSSDRSLAIARRYANRVIASPKGRAIQMNEGAKVARGEILLFLHADCYLEEGSLGEIEETLSNDGYIGGCFHKRIVGENILFRLSESSGNIRARLTKIFYGDRGIFVLKKTFFQLGGFSNLTLFEDSEFSKRLPRLGKTVILKKKIFVSARRRRNNGIFKTTFLFLLVTVLYVLDLLGSHPENLSKLYKDIR